MTCLFIPFAVSFTEQMLLILIKSSFSIFFCSQTELLVSNPETFSCVFLKRIYSLCFILVFSVRLHAVPLHFHFLIVDDLLQREV